jgi:hypothetical protein
MNPMSISLSKPIPVIQYIHIQNVTNGDVVALVLKWEGGKGAFAIQSLTHTNPVALSIDWLGRALDLNGAGVVTFDKNLVNEPSPTSGTIYEFEALPGLIEITLQPSTGGNFEVVNAFVFQT